MSMIDQQQGSAAVNGELWGARARDWADLQEGNRRLDVEECLRQTAIGQGTAVLDLGCGAGGFCRFAAAAGARVTGIDAAPAMVKIARERVPTGCFDVGDIQFLPYDDRSFDVVTAFHSLPFAAGPLAALIEARRVAKPGASLFIVIFGREEHNELAGVLRALQSLLPPKPPGGPGPLALSGRGTLDDLLAHAGVRIAQDGDIDTAYEYPDHETALRAIRSAGLTVLAERTAGKDAIAKRIASALAPHRTPTGGYRLDVESRYIVATTNASRVRRHRQNKPTPIDDCPLQDPGELATQTTQGSAPTPKQVFSNADTEPSKSPITRILVAFRSPRGEPRTEPSNSGPLGSETLG